MSTACEQDDSVVINGEGRLPNFLAVGAMRAGTTSLWQCLRSHPDVHMPAMKEPTFFVEEANWRRGLDWYRRLFENATDETAVGEASAHYSNAKAAAGVPERVAATLGEVRIIYLLRDPVERLVSEYRAFSPHEQLPPLEEFVLDDDVLSRSMYGFQLEGYLRVIDRERILVLTYEDFVDEPLRVLQTAFEFLGVWPHWTPPMTTRVYGRAEGERPALRAATRETVIGRLRPDLERLRDHLGGDFHCWGLLDPSQDRPAAVARSSTPRRTTSGVDAFPDRFEVRGRVPDGFRLLPDYVSPGEQEAIWAWIHDPANLSFKRRVTGVAAQEVLAEVEGFPAWASRLAGRMHAQGIVSLVPDNLHFMRYESGEGIGAHVNPRYLGTFVAVLNLGSTRVFELENDAERSAVRVLLRPGDVYLISGEALRSWVHGVPATRVDDFKGRRYQRQAAVSVQWRHIADRAPFEGENVATWRRELDHAAAPARSWG